VRPGAAILRSLPGLLLLVALASSSARAAVPFLLPEGEPPGAWSAALVLAGRTPLDPALPRAPGAAWVELQHTARPDTWRLRVRDAAGSLHEVEVPAPRTDRARDEVVALAASLLHPVEQREDFWASSQRPPPLPPTEEEPPPLPPILPPPPPVEPQPAPEPVEAEAAPGPAALPEEVVEPPPLVVTVVPTVVEPVVEPEAIVPAPPVVSADLPPRSAPLQAWLRLGGAVDLGLGAPALAAGGAVEAGAQAARGLLVGVGAHYETRRLLVYEDVDDMPRGFRESDVYLLAAWSPSWRVAPRTALRAGASVATFYSAEWGDGAWPLREADSLVSPLLGAELGLSLPIGSHLAVQPFALGQVYLGDAIDPLLTDDTSATLERLSLHGGLALVVTPALTFQ